MNVDPGEQLVHGLRATAVINLRRAGHRWHVRQDGRTLLQERRHAIEQPRRAGPPRAGEWIGPRGPKFVGAITVARCVLYCGATVPNSRYALL